MLQTLKKIILCLFEVEYTEILIKSLKYGYDTLEQMNTFTRICILKLAY